MPKSSALEKDRSRIAVQHSPGRTVSQVAGQCPFGRDKRHGHVFAMENAWTIGFAGHESPIVIAAPFHEIIAPPVEERLQMRVQAVDEVIAPLIGAEDTDGSSRGVTGDSIPISTHDGGGEARGGKIRRPVAESGDQK